MNDSNPLLLLHGALGSATQLSPMKAALEKHGRQVVVVNFSGHAGEPFNLSGFGIDTFAQDVLAFLDRTGLAKVDIFGYSMGGYVALWFAHRYPGRVGRIVTLGTKFDWNPESAAREIRKMDPDKIAAKVPAFARILEGRHGVHVWRELLAKTAAMMKELGDKPLLTEETFEAITNPVEIVLGDLDDMADRAWSEQVAGMLPRGSFRLLENTPHPIEKTDFVPFLELR